jgi:creatinine amidohydrolase
MTAAHGTLADLLPHEIVAVRDAGAAAIVPVGPLEWHGPHLPLGTDPLHAREVATRVALAIGGIVLPPVFAGTETVVPAAGRTHDLASMGLQDGDRVIGMDFPGMALKSLYAEESSFALTMREVVRGLIDNGFRAVVIVNGHGATNHQSALERVAAEAEHAHGGTVVVHPTFGIPLIEGHGDGHATRAETSVMLALYPDRVRLDLLPPRDEPLRYSRFAIVDGPAFGGEPGPGFTVRAGYDPREATAQEGVEILDLEVANAVARLASLGIGR